LDELRKPFHPSQVTWKPGAVKGERALALAYADLRAYMNRLDEVCGTEWSVAYEPWGEDRIICRLTIFGVTRSSTGETTNESERSEIGGTVAEAQAFKRASAMFGLGRYLYNLPTGWADYDPATKRFTDKAKAKLIGILVQQYRRATEGKGEMAELFALDNANEEAAPEIETPKSAAPQKPVEAQKAAEAQKPTETPKSKEVKEVKEAREAKKGKAGISNAEFAELFENFNALGQELYGEQWTQVCQHNVNRISGGKTQESGELTPKQIEQLIAGMEKLKSQRMPELVTVA
jgi:hypothetical protein